MTDRQAHDPSDAASEQYLTVGISDQLFGLPILQVEDVFVPRGVTPVPLADDDIAGVLNLRGRIVTAIDMRARLGLPRAERGASPMAVGVGHDGESYGLIVDRVLEVHRLPLAAFESNPANLDPVWSSVSAGVHQLEERLMVVLDVGKILGFDRQGVAA